MNRLVIGLFIALFVVACDRKEKYDVNTYYDLVDQDKILTSIVAYIFTPPPYTKKEDRLKAEHRPYYSSINGRFKIEKYFIAENGVHYFYVIRPAVGKDKRGVGGHFRLNKDFSLVDFREEYVTPALPEEEVKGRCSFLFDEMVHHNLEKFLTMETYVQWPNKVSYYDSIAFEWKLLPNFEEVK